MANIATLIAGKITKTDNYFNVPINVIINDGLTDILNFVVSARYSSGTNPSVVIDKLRKKIKTKWDKYKAEKAIEDSASLAAAVIELKTQMDTYIN